MPYYSQAYGDGSGLQGPQGDSAYQVALAAGFVGTEAEWLASIVGAPGPQGLQGPTGNESLVMQPGQTVSANTFLYAAGSMWYHPEGAIAPNDLTSSNLKAAGFINYEFFAPNLARNATNAALLVTLPSGSIVQMGGRLYMVDPSATGADSATNDLSQDGLVAYGVKTPEHYGSDGLSKDAAKDTLAWNLMLRAIANDTVNGPVIASASGSYLVDQLFELSQYTASNELPRQQNDVSFMFDGAEIEHSGVGDGIISFEGNGSNFYKVDLVGGVFSPHSTTKWLTRSRDLRTSLFAPNRYGGATGVNSIGHISELWRTWSENMAFGGNGKKIDIRKITHGIALFGRAESWAQEAFWSDPTLFVQATNLLKVSSDADAVALKGSAAEEGDYYHDAVTSTWRLYTGGSWTTTASEDNGSADISIIKNDADAVALKGSAAEEGDYYYRREAGYGGGYRIYRSSGWVNALYSRGDVFGWKERPISASAPTSPEHGDLYYSTTSETVNIYDGSAWQSIYSLEDVSVNISGRSFARTDIKDIVLAAPHDDTADGQAIIIQNGAAYETEIKGIKGVADNNGGSLIYWNVAFGPGSEINHIGIEKANIASKPRAFAVRVGPNLSEAPNPPHLKNIRYSTSRSSPVDPKAGIVWEGQDYEHLLDVVAGTPIVLVDAGMLWSNSMFEIFVKTNGNEIVSSALVARKSGSSGLYIIDKEASRHIIPFTAPNLAAATSLVSMSGNRWVAPRSGSLLGITTTTDADVSAGSVNCETRLSAGDLNSVGSNPGVEAAVTSGFFAKFSQTKRTDTFEAGNNLYAVYETSADFSGPTEVQAALEVELNGVNEWSDSNGSLMLTPAETQSNLRVSMKVWKP